MAMIEIAGVWEGTDKNGNLKLSGSMGYKANILILKNNYKEEGSNQPDYKIYIAEKQGENRGQGSSSDAPYVPEGSTDPGRAPGQGFKRDDNFPFRK